jgi:hypothetical protein
MKEDFMVVIIIEIIIIIHLMVPIKQNIMALSIIQITIEVFVGGNYVALRKLG